MKAVRMVETGKPLELQQIPIPSAGEEDVLVRVRAAGICHSDAHYRAGRSSMGRMPITLGHEVAGEVEWVGSMVTNVRAGNRVCLHYNISCGTCYYCQSGKEQFCTTVKMIGHHIDGGYAEYIAVPAQNAMPLPDEISFEEGATLMCASATALHALRRGRARPQLRRAESSRVRDREVRSEVQAPRVQQIPRPRLRQAKPGEGGRSVEANCMTETF